MRWTLLFLVLGCGDDNTVHEDLSASADLSMSGDLSMTLPDDLSTSPPDLTGVDFSGSDLSYVDLAPSPDLLPGAKYDVTLTLINYDLHAGLLFTLYVKELPGDTLAAMGTIASLANQASQAITLTKAVTAGKSYNLDFWVDYNNNKACDAPPTDHAWRMATGVISGNYSVAKTHDTNWTNVCF
jgi:hypothetical protein